MIYLCRVCSRSSFFPSFSLYLSLFLFRLFLSGERFVIDFGFFGYSISLFPIEWSRLKQKNNLILDIRLSCFNFNL